MAFATPIALLLLIPWAAVTLWLMSGRGDNTHVPFLHLWRPVSELSRAKRLVETPPLAVAAALAAAFLAIAAASRPMLARRGDIGPPVTIARPSRPVKNISITRFSAVESPKPQVMLTVQNDSDISRTTLSVQSGAANLKQEIDLPPAGQQKNYFVDLPSLAQFAIAAIDVNDDLPADNTAFIARQRSWPKVEIRSAVSPQVQRVVAAYERSRPPQPQSPRIAVTSSGDVALADAPAAIVAIGPAENVRGTLNVSPHPIIAGVNWQSLKLQITGAPPGGGWTPVLSAGAKPLIATRTSPQKQVWVGIDAPEFARTPEYVVLWTNIFDWLGSGAAAFDSSPPVVLGDEWQLLDAHGDPVSRASSTQTAAPGVYRRSDGALRAIALAPQVRDDSPTQDWPAKLAALQPRQGGGYELSRGLLFAAIACLLLVALAWPGRRLTPFSARRTV
jgi:hypothetical protein